MSLNWNVLNVANSDEICWIAATADDPMRGIKKGDKVVNPVTETLVWLTMGTAIGWDITEDNVDEFIARIRLWEAVHGPALTQHNEAGGWADTPLSEDQIRAHIGLHVNVSYEPRADWQRRFLRNVQPEVRERALATAGAH